MKYGQKHYSSKIHETSPYYFLSVYDFDNFMSMTLLAKNVETKFFFFFEILHQIRIFGFKVVLMNSQ